jgi:hypothetical protein
MEVFIGNPLKKEFDPAVKELRVIKSDADIEAVKLEPNTDASVKLTLMLCLDRTLISPRTR